MENIVELSERLAIDGHKGQFRNDGVEPYINHPIRVRLKVSKIINDWNIKPLEDIRLSNLLLQTKYYSGLSNINDFIDVAEAVSLEHDLAEDVEAYPLTRIITIFRENTSIPDNQVQSFINSIKAITKTKGEDYLLYLKRVKNEPIARLVKYFDIEDNLTDLLKLEKSARRDKYRLAQEYLLS